MTAWKEVGKDKSPSETIRKIEEIITNLGLETKHKYIDTDIKACYSSRVVIAGDLCDIIGTNGKGISLEFCQASAYAELIERMQNRTFAYGTHPQDNTAWQAHMDAVGNSRTANRYRTADDIPENSTYVQNILRQITDSAEFPIRCFGEQTVLKMLDNEYLYFPMYDVTRKKYIDLPALFMKLFTHSNGMASGNTVEEAIVQACSEIIERLAQTEIMEKRLTPPDVPEDIITRYPSVQSIVDEIKSSGDYIYYMKDCSLGVGFPVICSILINTENQSLGVRFGCHPHMRVAMERSLTEAFQGRKIEQFTNTSRITFNQEAVKNRINLMDTKKTGNGWYSPELITGKPSYQFKDWDYAGEVNNRELALVMTDKLQQNGYPVYIQDVSFLGFPSVFVIVEGASELRQRDFLYLKEMRLSANVASYLLDIPSLTDEKVRKIAQLCRIKRNAIMENSIGSIYKLPFDKTFYSSNESDFLLFVCHYYLDEREEATKALERCKPASGHEAFLRTVKLYVSARYNGYDSEHIRKTLNVLCGAEMAERTIQALDQPKKAFETLYPVCNSFNCAECKNTYCRYPSVREFDEVLWRHLSEWGDGKSSVHKIFEM